MQRSYKFRNRKRWISKNVNPKCKTRTRSETGRERFSKNTILNAETHKIQKQKRRIPKNRQRCAVAMALAMKQE